jgi:hypothetical protein
MGIGPSGIKRLKRSAIILFKTVYIFLKVVAAAAAAGRTRG